jgi:hypothetical protein
VTQWNPPPDGGFPGGERIPGAPRIPGTRMPPNVPIKGAPRAPGGGAGPLPYAAPEGPTKAELEADPSYGQRQRAYTDPFPAWNPDYSEFYVQDEASVAANVVRQELVFYPVPRQSVVYVRGFGQDALCGAFTEVTWELALGGRIVQLFKPIAQVGTFLEPATMAWPVPSGTRISVLVTTGANPRDLAAMLHLQQKNLDLVAPERF